MYHRIWYFLMMGVKRGGWGGVHMEKEKEADMSFHSMD